MDKVLAHFKSKAGFILFRQNSRKRQLGFTLIELIIAIVIMVILTTIGVASFNSASQSNAIQQQAQELKSLARKLRTDASAAIKPAGDCSLPVNKAVIYGTYLYFKNGSSDYYYGIACFNPTTATSYSSINHSNLKTPLLFGGFTQNYMALLYTFDGQVVTYTFNTGLPAPVIQTIDFDPPLLFEKDGVPIANQVQDLLITDGTASRNYRINFSASGLVCEEKASISPSVCAAP